MTPDSKWSGIKGVRRWLPPFRWLRCCSACDHSPDGKRIVNTFNGSGVQVRDAATGAVLADRFLGSARFVDWSPDGKKIAVGRFDVVCSIVDAVTLETIRDLSIPSGREGCCVRWRPDSRLLADVSKCSEVEKRREIRIHDAETGELVWAMPENVLLTRHLAWRPDWTRLACSDTGRTKIWRFTDGQPQFELHVAGGGSYMEPGRFKARRYSPLGRLGCDQRGAMSAHGRSVFAELRTQF